MFCLYFFEILTAIDKFALRLPINIKYITNLLDGNAQHLQVCMYVCMFMAIISFKAKCSSYKASWRYTYENSNLTMFCETVETIYTAALPTLNNFGPIRWVGRKFIWLLKIPFFYLNCCEWCAKIGTYTPRWEEMRHRLR